ncbi:hypothetical protein BKA70DRAFT_1097883 [Coprinopsis sp. MPI-PUGE-AT-0042]|nr:hypothetical protein BKA70DRAFT_1097883 [Coprinopsis sp. MPI-PUGE-AT-0042]
MVTFALCALFMFSTRVVLSSWAMQLSFTEARQCEPFTFTLQGQIPQGVGRPTSLSIIPFDSTPVVIPIPNPQAADGSFTTTLPYPADTRFLASLEDGTGTTVLPASEIMKVGKSEQDGANSCIDANPSPVQHFSFQDEPAQCQEFSIAYNTSAVPRPPQIRAYSPQGSSILLNQTSADFITGSARYVMSAAAGTNVVLLIDGGNGIRETTKLFTVAGGSSSSGDCLANPGDDTEVTPVGASKAPGISSRSIIIGSVAGGAAVVLIAVAMCIYVLIERRKRRKTPRVSFHGSRMQRDPEMDEKRQSPLPTFSVRGTSPEPPRKLIRSPKRDMRTDSLASWLQATPDDQKAPASTHLAPPTPPRHQSLAPSLAQSESRNIEPQSLDDRDRLSINSLDIEGMLNMATMQSEAARKGSTPSFFGTDQGHPSPSPPRIITNLTVPRRALKVNSDIPDDLQSVYSRDSVNPFTTPVYGESPFTAPAERATSGLPVSPRNAGRPAGRVPVGRNNSPVVHSRTSSEWYGFGEAR